MELYSSCSFIYSLTGWQVQKASACISKSCGQVGHTSLESSLSKLLCVTSFGTKLLRVFREWVLFPHHLATLGFGECELQLCLICTSSAWRTQDYLVNFPGGCGQNVLQKSSFLVLWTVSTPADSRVSGALLGERNDEVKLMAWLLWESLRVKLLNLPYLKDLECSVWQIPK